MENKHYRIVLVAKNGRVMQNADESRKFRYPGTALGRALQEAARTGWKAIVVERTEFAVEIA